MGKYRLIAQAQVFKMRQISHLYQNLYGTVGTRTQPSHQSSCQQDSQKLSYKIIKKDPVAIYVSSALWHHGFNTTVVLTVNEEIDSHN